METPKMFFTRIKRVAIASNLCIIFRKDFFEVYKIADRMIHKQVIKNEKEA
jgi:hypothetical protein